MAAALLKQYAGPAIAAGSAVMHPMQANAALPRRPKSERKEHTKTSSLPTPGISYTSARSDGLTRAEIRQRKAELESQLQALNEHNKSFTSSSRSSSDLDVPSIHPLARRSPSHTMTMNEAQSMVYSMVGGQYEEIDRTEAAPSPKKTATPLPSKQGIRVPGDSVPKSESGTRASWFAWGGSPRVSPPLRSKAD